MSSRQYRSQLRSWRVGVKGYYEKTTQNSWGEPYSFHPHLQFYVVARTKASAMTQAKAMAGYPKDKRSSAKGIDGCEVLETFD